MRFWIAVGLFFAVVAVAFQTVAVVQRTDQQLPPGVTTGWPTDDGTTCGIGIHYEDTAALTDAQLQTARDYVMDHCYGGHTPPPGTRYYHHHD